VDEDNPGRSSGVSQENNDNQGVKKDDRSNGNGNKGGGKNK
jgi:hypothetical protein